MNVTEKSRVDDENRGSFFARRPSFMRATLWDSFDLPPVVPPISMDHPKRGECILFPEYTFRIETSSSDPVEISIDGEAWRPCRRAVGYWWYDWSGYRSGIHQAAARLCPREGAKTETRTCLFRVDLSGRRA